MGLLLITDLEKDLTGTLFIWISVETQFVNQTNVEPC